MRWILLWLATWLSGALAAQPPDSLRPPTRTLADLPAADQLLVDGENNLLLLDSERGRLYRYLAAFDYDSAVFIGGRSLRDEGLVHPSQMALVNRQELYLLDEAQGRLLVLNVNLKVIRRQDFLGNNLGSSFAAPQDALFPTAFAIGPTGEQFLVNRADNRIVKLNAFGQEELRFGGPDYGEGALFAPSEVIVDGQNFVYVADTSEQAIQVYDLYGVWRYRLAPELAFRWQHMRLFAPYLLLFDREQLVVYHLQRDAWVELPVQVRPPLHDVALTQDRLYVLGKNAVHLYVLAK